VIPFYRLSGAGNDFIVLVEPEQEPTAEQIQRWCARGLSEGADGLIAVRREGTAARLVHFNSDGGRVTLCINGTRGVARLAVELGWAEDHLDLLTDAGPVAARLVADDRIELRLGPPPAPRPIELASDGELFSGFLIDTGVPHLVLPWAKSLASVPVATLGPALRSHADLGPAGANVDFVRYPRRDRLELRTFERGVEGETLACGTGVLAVVAVGVFTGDLALPCEVLTAGGFVFQVAGQVESGRLLAYTVTADARIVARGELLPGALSLPPAPRWTD
jgi:diaminopimelate epimerase